MTRTAEFGTAPVHKLLWKYALPAIIAMTAMSLYNIVDSIYIGHGCGALALSALTVAKPFMDICAAFGSLVGVGASSLLAIYLGEKDYDKANRVLGNVIVLNIILSAIVMAVGLIWLDPILMAFGASEDTILYAHEYMEIILYGNILTHIYFGLNAMLRSAGHPRFSMIATLFAVIINIILDPIFIFALNMGVAGAAIATVIGQLCGCTLAIWFNHKKNTDITLSVKGFRPDFRLIGEIYAIGLPSVIMVAIGSVMTFLMNKILITYHTAHETAATAFGAYFKLNSFIFMPVFGLNNGVVPIVAYNYGAQNRRRMVETIKRGALYASCIMVLGTVLFWVIPGPLLKIFDASETLLSVGIPALRIISLSFCMAGACIALGSSFQALGKSVYSMITSIVRQLVFLIPIAYVLARYGASVGNSDLVWWSYPIAEVFSLTLTLCFFRHVYKTTIAPLPEGRE